MHGEAGGVPDAGGNYLWLRDITERDLFTDRAPRPSSEGAAARTPSVSAEVAERLRRTLRWHPRSPRKLCSQFSASAVVQLEVSLIAFALLLKRKKSRCKTVKSELFRFMFELCQHKYFFPN